MRPGFVTLKEDMAKQKKKRNKVYRGRDAKLAQPQVLRVEAANRGRIGQWWFEKKKFAKPVAIAAAVVLLIGWLLFELIRAIF